MKEVKQMRDYCYGSRVEGVDKRARRKLITASILCLFFMLCMIVGGILSNSLAIATDAAHLLTDLASFLISLFAIWLAGRPSTERILYLAVACYGIPEFNEVNAEERQQQNLIQLFDSLKGIIFFNTMTLGFILLNPCRKP
uniref:Cation efflux protein transmembrane domain-containing protein n=1 Tax=Glossina brevipalpis TaxID=37001 RepID=A0A1A9WZH5_9MUSC